eukprot:COSAG01_NODE_52144_length_349_cov_0.360000_1_plen_37_part_01
MATAAVAAGVATIAWHTTHMVPLEAFCPRSTNLGTLK